MISIFFSLKGDIGYFRNGFFNNESRLKNFINSIGNNISLENTFSFL